MGNDLDLHTYLLKGKLAEIDNLSIRAKTLTTQYAISHMNTRKKVWRKSPTHR